MIDFKKKEIIGMIHLAGPDVVQKALDEIKIYEEEGLSGIIVENYHGSLSDVIDVLDALQENPTSLSVGINILPKGFSNMMEAVSTAFLIANKYEVEFIQFDYVSGKYEGSDEIHAERFMPYRMLYDGLIFGGVWPKYYEPVIGSNLSLDIRSAWSLSDAIVVTGEATGEETPLDKVKKFREILDNENLGVAKGTPLIVGAGLTPLNVREQLAYAQGAIVGSAFKPRGRTNQMVDRDLVKVFMEEVRKIEGNEKV